jgi:hypothetical protein
MRRVAEDTAGRSTSDRRASRASASAAFTSTTAAPTGLGCRSRTPAHAKHAPRQISSKSKRRFNNARGIEKKDIRRDTLIAKRGSIAPHMKKRANPNHPDAPSPQTQEGKGKKKSR